MKTSTSLLNFNNYKNDDEIVRLSLGLPRSFFSLREEHSEGDPEQ